MTTRLVFASQFLMRCPSSRIDEIPWRPLDVEDVLQNLLVVADREELVARVALRAVLRRAEHDPGAASRETPDLAAPLRLERRRANDEHLVDVRLPRQELRYPDSLDRLAEPHVVRQDRAPGADGEGDPVELVRQKRHREQLRSQRMLLRSLPDLRGHLGEPLALQHAVDEGLRVGCDEERLAQHLELAQACQQPAHFDRCLKERLDDRARSVAQPLGQRNGERWACAVPEMYGDTRPPVWLPENAGRKPLLDRRKHLHGVLAGPERVLPEVGAGAVRDPSVLAAQRDTVRLAAQEVGHGVVRPRASLVLRANPHSFGPGPIATLGDRRLDERVVVTERPQLRFRGRLGEPEAALVLEDVREESADVQAGAITRRAYGAQLCARRRFEHEASGRAAARVALVPDDHRFALVDAKVLGCLQLEGAPFEQQTLAPRAQELAGALEGQMRHPIAHGQRVRRLGAHRR